MPISDKEFAELVDKLRSFYMPWDGAPTTTYVPPSGDAVHPPDTLTWDWDSSLRVDWDAPTTGGPVKDYIYRIYASKGGTLYREAYTAATFFEWTLDQQWDDVGGMDPIVYVEVASRSFGGGPSPPIAATCSNDAPANPSGLIVDFTGINIIIEYDWPADTDVKEIRADLKITIP